MSGPLPKLAKLGRSVSAFLRQPRKTAENAVVRYCRRPHRRARLLGLVRLVPPLQRRVLRILREPNAGPSRLSESALRNHRRLLQAFSQARKK